jgi:hypothetical protein
MAFKKKKKIMEKHIVKRFFNQHLAYFQQDGATVHKTGATLVFLQQFYAHRVTRLGLHSAFPPRAPDLTPQNLLGTVSFFH